jgi:hypothetical protein
MSYSVGQGTFWFRLFGYGLWIRLRKHHVVLFSERYGHTKVYYIGPFVMKVLKP